MRDDHDSDERNPPGGEPTEPDDTTQADLTQTAAEQPVF